MADLKVIVTEQLTLNGKEQGGSFQKTITGITDVYKRIVTVPADVDTTLVSFKSTVGIADGAMDIQNVKYIRVTNLDSSNAVNLSLQIDTSENDTTAADSATVLLEAGKSFILGTPHDSVAVDDDDSAIVTTLNDLESILVDSSTHAVRMEILVASS